MGLEKTNEIVVNNKKYTLIFADFEVLINYTLVVFDDNNIKTIIDTVDYPGLNFNKEVMRYVKTKKLINENTIFIFFNGKFYDNTILFEVSQNKTTEELYNISQKLVKHGYYRIDEYGEEQNPKGYSRNIEYWNFLNTYYFYDCMLSFGQQLIGLKWLEHNNLDILVEKEESIDWDKPFPINNQENLTKFKAYCETDVVATKEIFFQYGLGRLEGVLGLLNMYNLSVSTLSAGDGSLAGKILNPNRTENYKEIPYMETIEHLLDQIDWDWIDFERETNQIHLFDVGITKEEKKIKIKKFFHECITKTLNGEDCKPMTIYIQNMPTVLGIGGIHGCNDGIKVLNDIYNVDVASYYPNIMLNYGLLNGDISLFKTIVNTRLEAKASGNKGVANALKIVINSSYGASKSKFNSLYNPLYGSLICIYGQLALIELTTKLAEYVKILQINTDGVCFHNDEDNLEKARLICKQWEKDNNYVLEEEKAVKLIQQNVNNYYMEFAPKENGDKGEIKMKGSYYKTSFSVKKTIGQRLHIEEAVRYPNNFPLEAQKEFLMTLPMLDFELMFKRTKNAVCFSLLEYGQEEEINTSYITGYAIKKGKQLFEKQIDKKNKTDKQSYKYKKVTNSPPSFQETRPNKEELDLVYYLVSK